MKKTHCKRGHEFSKENTYITPQGERVCKTCQAMHHKVWRSKNKQYFKDYRETHREQARASVLRWVEKNLEYTRARARKYRNDNLEKARANDRRWAKENPEKANAKNHKRATRITGAGGSYTVSEWESLCKKYNYRCLNCGKKRKLTADHVIPISKGGTSNIDNIQPLCGPCNSSKGTKTTDFRRRNG